MEVKKGKPMYTVREKKTQQIPYKIPPDMNYQLF